MRFRFFSVNVSVQGFRRSGLVKQGFHFCIGLFVDQGDHDSGNQAGDESGNDLVKGEDAVVGEAGILSGIEGSPAVVDDQPGDIDQRTGGNTGDSALEGEPLPVKWTVK